MKKLFALLLAVLLLASCGAETANTESESESAQVSVQESLPEADSKPETGGESLPEEETGEILFANPDHMIRRAVSNDLPDTAVLTTAEEKNAFFAAYLPDVTENAYDGEFFGTHTLVCVRIDPSSSAWEEVTGMRLGYDGVLTVELNSYSPYMVTMDMVPTAVLVSVPRKLNADCKVELKCTYIYAEGYGSGFLHKPAEYPYAGVLDTYEEWTAFRKEYFPKWEDDGAYSQKLFDTRKVIVLAWMESYDSNRIEFAGLKPTENGAEASFVRHRLAADAVLAVCGYRIFLLDVPKDYPVESGEELSMSITEGESDRVEGSVPGEEPTPDEDQPREFPNPTFAIHTHVEDALPEWAVLSTVAEKDDFFADYLPHVTVDPYGGDFFKTNTLVCLRVEAQEVWEQNVSAARLDEDGVLTVEGMFYDQSKVNIGKEPTAVLVVIPCKLAADTPVKKEWSMVQVTHGGFFDDRMEDGYTNVISSYEEWKEYRDTYLTEKEDYFQQSVFDTCKVLVVAWEDYHFSSFIDVEGLTWNGEKLEAHFLRKRNNDTSTDRVTMVYYFAVPKEFPVEDSRLSFVVTDYATASLQEGEPYRPTKDTVLDITSWDELDVNFKSVVPSGVLTSVEEFYDFLWKEELTGRYSKEGKRLAEEIAPKYGEEFFRTRSLLMLKLTEPSGGNRLSLRGVTLRKDGTLEVDLVRTATGGTDDVGMYLFLIELPDKTVGGANPVKVLIREDNEGALPAQTESLPARAQICTRFESRYEIPQICVLTAYRSKTQYFENYVTSSGTFTELDIEDLYDEEFFSKQYLVAVHHTESDSSVSVAMKEVLLHPNGTLEVVLTRTAAGGTDDVAEYLFFIAIPVDTPVKKTAITVEK